MRRSRIRLLAVAVLTALPFLALALAEGAARIPLWHPRFVSALPPPLVRAYQRYYREFDRDVIQYDPACAQYDPGLFYTLRPGGCTFTTREFSVRVGVNRLGTRGADTDVDQPDAVQTLKVGDIIVLPANQPHAFCNPGPGDLRLLGIHVNPERIVHRQDEGAASQPR